MKYSSSKLKQILAKSPLPVVGYTVVTKDNPNNLRPYLGGRYLTKGTVIVSTPDSRLILGNVFDKPTELYFSEEDLLN